MCGTSVFCREIGFTPYGHVTKAIHKVELRSVAVILFCNLATAAIRQDQKPIYKASSEGSILQYTAVLSCSSFSINFRVGEENKTNSSVQGSLSLFASPEN